MFIPDIMLWEKKKNIKKKKKVASPEIGVVENSVADNYLRVTLHGYNCHGFYLLVKRFPSCLF